MMRSVRWGAAMALSMLLGCRIGYDPLPEDGEDGGTPGVDAPPGAIDAPSGAIDAPPGSEIVLDEAAVRDTVLNSAAASLNYGAGQFFNVRGDAISTFTGVVDFDTSGLAGMTVTAAQVEVTTTTAVLSGGEVTAYRVLEDWDEGAESGGTGVASWDERLAGVAWAAAGCDVGSRDSTALDAIMPYTTSTTYSFTIPAATAQAWVDDPSSNHGIALVASGHPTAETVGFVSREGSGTGPTLRMVVE